jgi:hypothetical protein
MQKNNNLFIFGDSFSGPMMFKLFGEFGFELQPHWFEIISEKLDLTLSMYSQGGCCNQQIIDNFYFNIEQLKSGDVAIIGDTAITRIMGYSEEEGCIYTLNNDEYFPIPKDTYEVVESELNSKKDRNLVHYIYHNVIKYEKEWRDYYEKHYNNIIKICQQKGVECYFWSYDYWWDFTSISMETNHKIIDSHWGPNGNKYFADYMLHRIKNKDYYNTITAKDFKKLNEK